MVDAELLDKLLQSIETMLITKDSKENVIIQALLSDSNEILRFLVDRKLLKMDKILEVLSTYLDNKKKESEFEDWEDHSFCLYLFNSFFDVIKEKYSHEGFIEVC